MCKHMAKFLLDIEAVQINPKEYFTWTSGMKSPIYCDNRLTISYPKVREHIVESFIHLIEKLELDIDVIAGCATAGIPHAAFLAEALGLPMVYVRSDKKSHGKENQIEGVLHKDERVLVIEDLISTGSSAIQAAQALQKEGANIAAVFAIFTYELKKAERNFAHANLVYQTITNFSDTLHVLTKEGKLSQEDKEELMNWRNQLEA